MRITNARNGRIVAFDVEIAHSIIARLVGLIGRERLPIGCALIIPACKQIHTLFMRFPIDVVYTDSSGRVLCTYAFVKPYGLTGYCLKASQTIELPDGTISAADIRTGDVLRIEEGTQ